MSENSFITTIEKYKQNNLITYKDPSRIYADFSDEIETTNEYNGRQIFELLQNVEDANSDIIEFDLDTKNKTLLVSNKGDAFSVEGIHSLMIAHLSSKNKVQYIGNKGLGFRSILNWAESVSIYSNDSCITFSEEIARKNLDEIDVDSKQEIIRLKTKDHYHDEVVAFPILGIPEIENKKNDTGWITQIKISYRKEFEQAILEQLNSINDEVLLFLNSIKKIIYKKNEIIEKIIEVSKKNILEDNVQEITIGNNSWTVFSLEDALPKKYQDRKLRVEEHYEIKIAISDDFDNANNLLYSFFPTQISIALPCIIHGTFDIDSSRKTINDSPKNEYIFERIPYLFEIIIDYLKIHNEETINWNLIKLLKTRNKNSDFKYIKNLYERLENLINTLEIFPSVDSSQKYKSRDEIKYYSDELSFKIQNAFNDIFPEMSLPLEDNYKELSSFVVSREYDPDVFWQKMESVVKEYEFTLDERVELIQILAKLNLNCERFSLLINTKDEVIDADTVCFTVPPSDEISLPNFIVNNIDIINNKLYEKLAKSFMINESDVKNKSRALVNKIKTIVNIQSYDFSEITDRIITEEKRIIEDTDISFDKKSIVIKETVLSLFINFINSNSKIEKLEKKVPYLLSKSNSFEIASNLYLSDSYISGQLTEEIYGNIIPDNEYIINKTFWNINFENNEIIENFFFWLGVNKYIKVEDFTFSFNKWHTFQDSYIDYFCKSGEFDSINYTLGELKSIRIVESNIEKLKQLSPSKIICLLSNEKKVSASILVNSEENITFHYSQSVITKTINTSYIMFQLKMINCFSSILLEEMSDELKNVIGQENFIDYDWLKDHHISKEEANALLIKIGAQKTFDSLSQDQLYSLIKKQSKIYKGSPEKTPQKIYQFVVDALDKKVELGEKLTIDTNLLYCCKKEGKYCFVKASDCYYSDNAVLPKKIMKRLPILNIGSRKGELKVERCFGIKTIKSENVNIKLLMDEKQKLSYEEKTKEFQKRFISRKAYILAFRLDKVSKEESVQANALSNFSFKLIGNGQYSFGKDDPNDFEDYDFIMDGNKAIIKVPDLALSSLLKEPLFLDAFSECLCILFKITESNELKNIFRNSIKDDISDLKHVIETDMQEGVLEHCISLLKIKYLIVSTFWEQVLKIINKSFPTNVVSIDELYDYISSELKIDINILTANIDYEKFDTESSVLLISTLEKTLHISAKELLPINGFESYHKQRVQNFILDYTSHYEKQLYNYLENHVAEQNQYISLLNQYHNIDNYEQVIKENKYICYPNYLGIIQSKIDNKYNIDLEKPNTENLKIQNLYEDIFVDYDEKNLPDMIRSLVYFPNHKEELLEYIKKDRESFNSESSDKIESDKEIIDAELDAIDLDPYIPSNNSSNTGNANDNDDKKKKRVGKKAELDVFDKFVNKFGEENVQHISGNSNSPYKNDRAHCDFVYKIPGTTEWRCLEVKHVSNGVIILTAQEKEFGCKDENKKRYDFALVDDDKIHLIKNVFDFPTEDTFENNTKFKISTKDYYLRFKIQDNEDQVE